MNSEGGSDKEEEDPVKTLLSHQLTKQHQENKDVQMMIEVLHDKIKRMEGKEKLVNDGVPKEAMQTTATQAPQRNYGYRQSSPNLG